MPEFRESDGIRLPHADPPLAEVADIAPTASAPARKKPFQFTLGRAQWLIVIACIASAGLGALLRIDTSDAGFITISLALLILPSGLLIAIGIARGGYELYKNWQADRKLWLPPSRHTQEDEREADSQSLANKED